MLEIYLITKYSFEINCNLIEQLIHDKFDKIFLNYTPKIKVTQSISDQIISGWKKISFVFASFFTWLPLFYFFFSPSSILFRDPAFRRIHDCYHE